ncbi:glycoside hydrolase family 88 protein [Cytophaga sp. FL35]|uniref:glycoside hydrolase family 88/105 protein n=1 Tax=Cytophaga sp. FL35 TaxID=1904456 RepID=UPI00165348C0|nr:glycoside hydrolase family 88 protein [Cytophaga sp. FL35]MBC6997339.1 glycoside hydrolase family 88 protein [Cytophaga sp. FL35]
MRFINKYVLGTLVILLTLYNCKPKTDKKEGSSIAPKVQKVVAEDLKWADRMALSIIHTYPNAWQTENDSLPKWNYKIGLLCTALEKLHKKTSDQRYLNYVKEYTDIIIDDNGKIKGYELENFNIDMINSGKMLFWLYDETENVKYLSAIKTLNEQYKDHPRTNSGGLWHKKIYPNQMWLDGLYMGAPFFAEYNARFEKGELLDDIAYQFELIWQKTYDEETGLLYHAWDESKQMGWADKETGKSANFWSRSLGWYIMALVDVLDFFPETHPKRVVLIEQLNQLSEALLKFQDESGVWYQVTNLPNREPNYLESSGSCMFAYGFSKGAEKGYLPSSYHQVALNIFDGIIKEFIEVEDNGLVHITKICKSAGLGGDPYRDGTFEYYMSEPIVTDNLHGLSPFILAAVQLNK